MTYDSSALIVTVSSHLQPFPLSILLHSNQLHRSHGECGRVILRRRSAEHRRHQSHTRFSSKRSPPQASMHRTKTAIIRSGGERGQCLLSLVSLPPKSAETGNARVPSLACSLLSSAYRTLVRRRKADTYAVRTQIAGLIGTYQIRTLAILPYDVQPVAVLRLIKATVGGPMMSLNNPVP